MAWEVEIIGDDANIEELAKLAPAYQCAITRGDDGRSRLSGPRLAAFLEPADAREEAGKVLGALNGLVRLLRHSDHRPARLGDAAIQARPEGGKDVAVFPAAVQVRARVSLDMTVIRADGRTEPVVSVDPSLKHAERIAADPALSEIARALADDVTWQRLRVAFERINALVGKGDNALVRRSYATQAELDRFKANVQDPRHSGLDAVHGVPQGALKSTKMIEQEGLAFVARLFREYVNRLP